MVEDISILEKYDINRDEKNDYEELETPLPTYLKSKDKIMFFAKYKFGTKLWELPMFLKGYTKHNCYNEFFHFGRNLVEGQVFPKLKVLDKKYVFKNQAITLQKPHNDFVAFVKWLESNLV